MIELPIMSRAKVLVAGDVMLDRYWYGSTSRISPEAPVPIVHVNDNKEVAGGAGNVALNICSLGARADLLGVIGFDEAGETLKRHLENINGYFQQDTNAKTITKLRIISQNQQLIRLDFEENFAKLDKAFLQNCYQQLLPEVNVVVLSDYGKGTLSAVSMLIDKAREAGLPVLVDPKGTDFSKYRGATLLTPNLKEFEQVVGYCETQEILEERGFNLIEKLKLDALLVTQGSKGMTLLHAEHKPLHLAAHAREVYDVTGAGDTVIAVLACALGAGQSLMQAAAISNVAAGIVVGHLGAASVTIAELRRTLQTRAAEEVEKDIRVSASSRAESEAIQIEA